MKVWANRACGSKRERSRSPKDNSNKLTRYRSPRRAVQYQKKPVSTIFSTRMEPEQVRGRNGFNKKGATLPKKYYPYCDNNSHSLNYCEQFRLSAEVKREWIKEEKRCWKCGRPHLARNGDPKKRCSAWERVHPDTLHDLKVRTGAEPVRGGSQVGPHVKVEPAGPTQSNSVDDQQSACGS